MRWHRTAEQWILGMSVCETATLDPCRATGTSLNRTDASDECPSQRCTTSEQRQPGVFTESHKCAQEWVKVGVEADDGPQEDVRLKVFHPNQE